jgi:hypothetical protein
MRRTLVVFALLVAACARMTWEGTQNLSRDVNSSPDALLAAAARALAAHGYTTRTVPANQMVVTVPHVVPEYARDASTGRDTTPDSWVLQVQVKPNSVTAGSTLSVAAFLVPRPSERSSTSVTMTQGVPVTAGQPNLFKEVQRVGNWIVDEAGRNR